MFFRLSALLAAASEIKKSCCDVITKLNNGWLMSQPQIFAKKSDVIASDFLNNFCGYYVLCPEHKLVMKHSTPIYKAGSVVRTLSKRVKAWVRFLALKTILLSLTQI